MTQEFGRQTAEILPTLSLEEKARITAGSGMFNMTGVERLGLPNWMTTDGPNGARGSSLLGSGEAKATCIPCGSALGATWNPDLVEELGAMLGREARFKAARVLLAPTVNLHRAPRAGRNFECYSEDPLLSGLLAAAYCRGVQSQGVITTVKHFVGNETETDRWTSNSVIDERALRELYLVPFEYAVKEGGSLGVMTSYNRLNGEYCTEQPWLLTDVLRHEWGFEGFVTTDWFAGGETEPAAEAGLDIEMPAGDRMYGSVLADAVRQQRVSPDVLARAAGRVLSTFERIGAFDDEPSPEQSIDVPAHRDLARRAASEAMVLLRNEPAAGPSSTNADATPARRPLLPLNVNQINSIAVIGPNAGRAQIMGGGSANLRPFHRTSPLDAIHAKLGDDVTISYAEGCNIDKEPPLVSGPSLRTPEGEPGFRLDIFDNLEWSGPAVGTANRDTSRILVGDEPCTGVRLDAYSVRATGTYTAAQSGLHRFQITQVTPSRMFLDAELAVDGITDPPPTTAAFFGFGSEPMIAERDLVADERVEIVIETTTVEGAVFTGLDLRVGVPEPDDPLGAAVAIASTADVAIVITGTNDDWETEGEDRVSLALPGHQDQLVAAVAKVNPNTVVVVNSGAPVLLPWAEAVPSIIHCWLGGQEMGDALVDVITGSVDPGGRLPTSFPIREEHSPAYGNFPGDNDQVVYAEGIFIGYRWYESRHLPVQFPFGHGLSYTSFAIGQPTLGQEAVRAGDTITVEVPVTNIGPRGGRHVVQCYVRPHRSRIVRPEKELKAFAKVSLDPGETTTVSLSLDSRAFAYWDPAQPGWSELRTRTAATLPQLQDQERPTEPGWIVETGFYDIVIGHSSSHIASSTMIELTAP